MCTATLRIGLNLIEGEAEILGPRGQHAPHIGGVVTAQYAKYRIAEHYVIGVALAHRLRIKLCKRLVKTRD